jgi:hypothetical protein
MKRALYALIIGTVLTGVAAAYASAQSKPAATPADTATTK